MVFLAYKTAEVDITCFTCRYKTVKGFLVFPEMTMTKTLTLGTNCEAVSQPMTSSVKQEVRQAVYSVKC